MASRGARRKTLVIAVPSQLLQSALTNLVKDIPDMKLVGSARDALDAFTLVQTLRPDLIILDHALTASLSSLMHVRAHKPRVLLLSSRRHPGTAPVCSQDCACAFVRDRAPTEHIRTMLRMVAKCETPSPGHTSCGDCTASSSLTLPNLPISEREYEVFVRIGHGEGNSAIAKSLGVSVKTIETHRESIKRKLGLDSAHALVKAAICWREGEFTADNVPMHLMNGKLI